MGVCDPSMKPEVLTPRSLFVIPRTIGVCLLACTLAGADIALAQDPQLSLQDRVAALKTTFGASQAKLRQYEWIETTVVSLNGEEKSRKQQRCYYGADGVLQKVLVDASPPPPTKPGLRGRIIANKTAQLTEYMQNAVILVKSYVPPEPARIQASKDAGKVTIQMLDPGKRAQVNVHDYQKPGDNLAIMIDLANNAVTGVGVTSYLDAATDVVTLDAKMGRLSDGTIYASDITLNGAAKNLTVAVQNTGYRKIN
jgi:hypothetical protein